MGTQQALTTKQLELLTLLYSIEEFVDKEAKEEMVTPIDEILISNCVYKEEEYDELTEALIAYGYVDDNIKLTTDGKQYIALFIEDLQKKAENPSIVMNNQFSLINMEAFNIDNFIKIAKECSVLDKVVNVVKLLKQLRNQ